MRDTDDEIREIKTEIIESRGLIIKTNNLTNSLAADIKSIARRQAGYERRFTLNSAVAYVLFATLSFVGLKLWSDVRINEIGSEKDELGQKVQELRRDLEEETRRAEKREQAEAKAAAYYDLVRKKDYARVVEGYDQIQNEQLSKVEAEVFRDTEERFRLQRQPAAKRQIDECADDNAGLVLPQIGQGVAHARGIDVDSGERHAAFEPGALRRGR